MAFALVVGLGWPALPLGADAGGGSRGCLTRRYLAEVVRVIDGDTIVVRVLTRAKRPPCI